MAEDNGRKPSMLDVAEKAGVSKSTVSCVLNGKPGVSEDTKAKVLMACKDMRYRINPNIQDFVRGNLSGLTRNIALVFVETEFADPAYARIIDGVAKGTEENKYHMLFARLTGAEETVYDLPPILRDGRVDGVLISGDIVPRVFSLLEEINMPSVVLGNYNESVTRGHSCVGIDFRAAVKMAVESLAKAGKTRIAFFAETLNHYSDKLILEAYKEALADENLPVNEDIIYIAQGSFSGAMGILKPIFKQDKMSFDSILCLDYRVAIEISHLIVGQAWNADKPGIALATARHYSCNKLPVPAVYIDMILDEVAYTGVEELLANLSQKKNNRTSTKFLTPDVVSMLDV